MGGSRVAHEKLTLVGAAGGGGGGGGGRRYAKINAIKIHNQWRKIMRLAKVEDLRKDIEILSQNHEREVDRKDAIIQVSAASRARGAEHVSTRGARGVGAR